MDLYEIHTYASMHLFIPVEQVYNSMGFREAPCAMRHLIVLLYIYFGQNVLLYILDITYLRTFTYFGHNCSYNFDTLKFRFATVDAL